MITANPPKSHVRFVLPALAVLCCLPESMTLAQQQQTVTVYVVYSRRQSEPYLSKGFETKDRQMAYSHADGLKRVQGPDGPIYAEVEVETEQRTVVKRESPPPREPDKKLPWKVKPRVGGDGEKAESETGKPKFFRPESEGALKDAVEAVNEAVEEDFSIEELKRLSQKVDFDDLEKFDEELQLEKEKIELDKRAMVLEELRKELEAEERVINAAQRAINAEDQRLKKLANSLKDITLVGRTAIGKATDNLDGSHSTYYRFHSGGLVTFSRSGFSTSGSYSVSGNTLKMTIGSYENIGTIRGNDIQIQYWGDGVRGKETISVTGAPLLGEQSAELSEARKRLESRRKAVELKTRKHKVRQQSLQRDQQVLKDRRKHNSQERYSKEELRRRGYYPQNSK